MPEDRPRGGDAAPPAAAGGPPPGAAAPAPEGPPDLVPLRRGDQAKLEELHEGALRLRVALGVGTLLWGGFLGIDFVVARYVEPGPLAPYVIARLVGLVAFGSVWYALGQGIATTQRRLRAIDLGSYTLASILTSHLCVQFRGLESPYASGVPLVLLCHTLTMSDSWRRNAWVFGVPALAYPATMLASSLWSPLVAQQLREPRALGTFAVHLAVVLSTYVFLLVGGQIMFDLRKRARTMQSIGRYRLVKMLGKGGMGEVWVARHDMMKRDVALKVLRPAIAKDPTAIARFEREARATAELTHPNTVRIFDYGTTPDGLWYYAMEVLEGRDLLKILQEEGPVEPVRAARIIAQAARALHEAHERGIIHRDVKPENIFVTRVGGDPDFVKLLDFGIAKVPATGSLGAEVLTADGHVVGTPVYMAPEVMEGQTASSRSDVYALGVVLYFLLCARRPFEGASFRELLMAHAMGPPLAPSQKRGSPIPKDLEDIVLRSISRRPEKRPQTSRELAKELEAFVLRENARLGRG